MTIKAGESDKFDVVIIHRTVGAEYDSRVRKMLDTIKSANKKCLAIFWERRNIPSIGKYGQGLPYITMRLPISSKKVPRPGPFFSAIELIQETIQGFLVIVRYCKSTVIIQNHRLFLLVSLLNICRPQKIKRIIWDLRELPVGFTKKNSFTTKLFSTLLSKCDTVFVTNHSRLKLMQNIYGKTATKNIDIVSNYVDSKYIEQPKNELSEEIKKLLGDFEYYYVQNPATLTRYPANTITAILKSSSRAVVITGRLPNQVLRDLSLRFGAVFDNRVHYLGMIPEKKLINIIDNAYASIILYDRRILNNEYCDSNRLYQSLSRGIPVIVGQNKSLSNLVSKYNNGLIIDDDGDKLDILCSGIVEFENNYLMFKQNAMVNATALSWDKNKPAILKAITNESVFV